VEAMGERKGSNNGVRVAHAAMVWPLGLPPQLRTAEWGTGERTDDLPGDGRQHLGELSEIGITQAVESATKAFRLATVGATQYPHQVVHR
jgi:hypothetical protein